jgi:hypothetical protein
MDPACAYSGLGQQRGSPALRGSMTLDRRVSSWSWFRSCSSSNIILALLLIPFASRTTCFCCCAAVRCLVPASIFQVASTRKSKANPARKRRVDGTLRRRALPRRITVALPLPLVLLSGRANADGVLTRAAPVAATGVSALCDGRDSRYQPIK